MLVIPLDISNVFNWIESANRKDSSFTSNNIGSIEQPQAQYFSSMLRLCTQDKTLEASLNHVR